MANPRSKNPFELFNNKDNNKIIGQVITEHSKQIFNIALEMLQQVPFDSQAADIIIAGVSIHAMAYQDSKYGYKGDDRLYPHKSHAELFDICIKNNPNVEPELTDIVWYVSDEEAHKKHNQEQQRKMIKRSQDIIKAFGHHALIEKDIGFDGNIPRFNTKEFYDSDWSTWTNRFDKYNLPRSQLFSEAKSESRNRFGLFAIGATVAVVATATAAAILYR